jgi:V8-like Glu-specific endopeptidase
MKKIVNHPLTATKLKLKKNLEAIEKPKEPAVLNLGTFRIPEHGDISLVKNKELPGHYNVQAKIPLDKIGIMLPPEKIPSYPLRKEKLGIRQLKIEPVGFRPKYLPVKFLPELIKLGIRERTMPPPDFDYVVRGEKVDRPTNVFPPDSRYIYHDTAFPWCTVGRVDSSRGYCAGVTIGSRLLLTCNHVIQWNADGTCGWVRFRPAFYNNNAPFGEAWATNVIWWLKTTPGDGLSDKETAFDYVVCVLDTRIGDIVGYPGYRTYNDDWNGGSYWQHMGYPSDLSGGVRPAFQGGCVISSKSNESTSGETGYVLGHFNDIVAGHSGGPVWGWWDDEPWPRVVGVQSAEATVPANNTSGDNEFGGGPALSDLTSWSRSNYP